MKKNVKEFYHKYDYKINSNFILETIINTILITIVIFIIFIFDIKKVNAETISNTITISNVSMNYNYYDKNDKKTHQVNNIDIDSRYNTLGRYQPSNLNYKLGTMDGYKYGRNFDINFQVNFENEDWNTITGSFLIDQSFMNKFEYYYKWFTFTNSVNGEKNKFFKCAYKENETNTSKIDFTCINAKSGYFALGWTLYGTDMSQMIKTIESEKPYFSWFGMYIPLNYSIQSDVDLEGYGLDGYIEGPTDPKDPNATNTFLDNFPSIFDKDNNFILQLFTIPYNLFTKIINSFDSTCKTYNLGSIKGKDLKLPCIDLKKLLGNNLYNIIDIIFCGIIAINFLQQIYKIFINLMTLNPKFENITGIDIFK